jgi:hypothetical protein
MNRSRIKRTAIAGLTCATVAAAIGIATGAAAPSKGGDPDSSPLPGPPPDAKCKSSGRRTICAAPAGVGAGLDFGPGLLTGPPVHSEMVVPNKSGDDFITITQDSGKVDSVSGSQLTITEGTEQATYKTVTLDIPSDAKVIRDGKKADLSDLQQGDQVHVSQSPQNSFVFAADSQYQTESLKRFRQTFKDLPKPPGFQDGDAPPAPGMLFGRRVS